MKHRTRYQKLTALSLAACALPLAADSIETPDPIILSINEGEGSDPGENLAVFILDERVPTIELEEGTPSFGAFVFSDSTGDFGELGEALFLSDLFVSIDDQNHVEVAANDGSAFLDTEDGDGLGFFSEFLKDIQVYTGDAFGDGGGPFVSSDETRELDLSQQPDSDWGLLASSGPFEVGDSFQFGFRYRESDFFDDTATFSLASVSTTETIGTGENEFFFGRGEITIGSVQATGFQVSGAPGGAVTLGGAVNPIPEPSSVFALAGLLGLGLISRRRS